MMCDDIIDNLKKCLKKKCEKREEPVIIKEPDDLEKFLEKKYGAEVYDKICNFENLKELLKKEYGKEVYDKIDKFENLEDLLKDKQGRKDVYDKYIKNRCYCKFTDKEKEKLKEVLKNNYNIEEEIKIEGESINFCICLLNCTFKKDVTFFNCTFKDYFCVEDTWFEGKFKLINCNKKKEETGLTCYIKHNHFKKNCNFSDSKFNNFEIRISTFEDMVFLVGSKFQEQAKFHFMTFKDIATFRYATFCKGLAFDNTTFKTISEFFGIEGLDSEKSQENTTRETYRVIKHNLQALNNYIEAAKYHRLELEKYRKELCDDLKGYFKCKSLKCGNIFSKKIIRFFSVLGTWIFFFLNWVSSNYSTSWGFPVLWIAIVGFFTSFLMNFTWTFDCSWKGFKNLIEPKYLYPLLSTKDFFSSQSEKDYIKWLIFLFNKTLLSYLTYQFVTAVRRWTKFG